MYRVNISISKELHENLLPFKKNINVSRVCQNALAKEIEILALIPTEDDVLQNVVEILRRGKEELKNKYKEIGFKTAIREYALLESHNIDAKKAKGIFLEMGDIIISKRIPKGKVNLIDQEMRKMLDGKDFIIEKIESGKEGYIEGTKMIYEKVKEYI